MQQTSLIACVNGQQLTAYVADEDYGVLLGGRSSGMRL
jgi:hypothetical protein